jgi:hypothetical protein
MSRRRPFVNRLDRDFADAVDRMNDRLNRVVEQAGPPPTPAARIVASNGGFELQVVALRMNGRWEYQREAWSRNRADVVDSARLRRIALA